MTQPLLIATLDSDIAPVTDGAVIEPVNARSEMAERHLRGDIAELLFCIAARERGYGVKWMQGSCKGYDVIIERYGQKPLFVQVKCSNLKPGNNWYPVSNNVGGAVYAPHAYDVLALYMWDRGEWVFYTREDLGNRTSTTYTPPEMRKQATGSGSPCARNPNNWELINDVAQSPTNSGGVGPQMSDPLNNTPRISNENQDHQKEGRQGQACGEGLQDERTGSPAAFA